MRSDAVIRAAKALATREAPAATLSASEAALVDRLRAAKLPPEFKGAPLRRVFRGLSGKLSDFKPVAREYRKGEHDLWTARGLTDAGVYGTGVKFDTKSTRGYVLDLKLPDATFFPHKDVVDLRRLPGKDLSPFILRIGRVSLDEAHLSTLVLKPEQATEAAILARLEAMRGKSGWADQQLRWRKAGWTSKTQQPFGAKDLENLNAFFIELKVREGLAASDPQFITWIPVRDRVR